MRLRELLAANPALAQTRIVETHPGCAGERSLLHVATDWPGHFPNVAHTVRILVEFGANVNARFVGTHQEVPLHWAASSDDVDALDALLDAGADIDATGSVIDGGSPLSDAVAFGQWNAAHRLVERGARLDLWHAAALGKLETVKQLCEGATHQQVTQAFWCACHGGQIETAQYLLSRGADLHWVGYDRMTPLAAAVRAGAAELAAWLRSKGAN